MAGLGGPPVAFGQGKVQQANPPSIAVGAIRAQLTVPKTRECGVALRLLWNQKVPFLASAVILRRRKGNGATLGFYFVCGSRVGVLDSEPDEEEERNEEESELAEVKGW